MTMYFCAYSAYSMEYVSLTLAGKCWQEYSTEISVVNVEKCGLFKKTLNPVRLFYKESFCRKISIIFSVFEDYVSKHNISKRQAADYEYFDYAVSPIGSLLEESSTPKNQSYYYRIRLKVHVRRRQEKESEIESERGHIDDPIGKFKVSQAELTFCLF